MSAMEDTEPAQEFVKSLTAKELKQLARPEFAANPDKFYPTKTLTRLGFSRAQCPVCSNNYWRHSPKKTTCGDSQCEKRYTFIGVGTGIGRGKEGKKITYAEAWEGFRRSLTTAEVPCTAIPRYPVVARWRADVDFVAAGIFCFQPYCVTGELDPPANPLICPQFCLRFNDLDNIGLTGRHYSGFIMLGIQVFNKPDAFKFWSDECVAFNYRWLTEELGVDPDEITFIEDVWAGGGNLGPSIEYFVGGLELGNMVFMQFKTFPDGRREPLQVQVIDVGIGLERVPWLINGSATSYVDVFPNSLKFMLEKTGLELNSDIWEKYGPHSCLLNVDEVNDLDSTWQWIADQVNTPVAEIKAAIEPIRDVYVVLDHTRCVMMAITDGSLPSNIGGASNIRNILRRTFAILHKNTSNGKSWWDLVGMEGLLQLFEYQKADLAPIYGEFAEYKSFNDVIRLEYERWCNTDGKAKAALEKILKKNKGKMLELNDWIQLVTSEGLPADTIAAASGQPIPGNMWLTIAERQERMLAAEPAILYSTAHLPATKSMYYDNHLDYDFTAKILEVMPNVTRNNELSVVILDQSHFYPTSGGQEHDTGSLKFALPSGESTHRVVDVLKVGPCVLHIIEPALPTPADSDPGVYKNVAVTAHVDPERREQLRNNHTATHIVFASCRRVLGPHIWQHGAKKSTNEAHLDVTHFESLTHEQTLAIENEANRIVRKCRNITKGFMPKDEAEKLYGFHLYQGGVVPGNELRVVSIEDTDTEACCGTHCDNTAEVGQVKILKTKRISDGILRIYFVAGENALAESNKESSLLRSLSTSWGVDKATLEQSATRFFEGYKSSLSIMEKQQMKILDLTAKVHINSPGKPLLLIRSDASSPTLFISNLPPFAEALKAAGKGIVVVGDTFAYGLLGKPDLIPGDAAKLINDLVPTLMAAADKRDAAAAAKAAKSSSSSEEKKDTESAAAGAAAPAAVAARKQPKVDAKASVPVRADKKTGRKAGSVDGVVEFKALALPDGSLDELVKLFVSFGAVEEE